MRAVEQIAATVQVDFAKYVAMNVASAPECPYRHGGRHLFHRFVRSLRSSFSSLYNVCGSVDIGSMRGAWERIVVEERARGTDCGNRAGELFVWSACVCACSFRAVPDMAERVLVGMVRGHHAYPGDTCIRRRGCHHLLDM